MAKTAGIHSFTATLAQVTAVGADVVVGPYVTNLATTPGNIGMFITCSGAATYSVQYTGDDVLDIMSSAGRPADPTSVCSWQYHPFLTSMTVATTAGNTLLPPSGIRLIIHSITTATFTGLRFNVIQPGWGGNR